MSASKKVRVLKAMRTILQEYKEKTHTTKVTDCSLCKLFHLNDVKPHECYLCPMYIFYKHDGWRFPCKNRKCEPVDCLWESTYIGTKELEPVDCLWESTYIGTKELEAVIEFYDEAIEKIKTMTNESLKKDNGKDNGFDFLVDIDKRIAKKYRLN
jgi:hypothetical protein